MVQYKQDLFDQKKQFFLGKTKVRNAKDRFFSGLYQTALGRFWYSKPFEYISFNLIRILILFGNLKHNDDPNELELPIIDQ